MRTDYEAVVFDNDGVLIEPTEQELLVDAVCDTFREFRVEPDREFARRTVEESLVPEEDVRERYGIDPEAFWRRREANAATVQRGAIRTGEKGLYDDVDAIADLEGPLGLVSNNQHATIEFILDHHDLAEHFDVLYGRECSIAGARKKKPECHYIERALADLGVSDALYVGDSPKDVVAAHRAGIDAAFLRREHRTGVDLPEEPDHEYEGLRELVDDLIDALA
ncbi:HAD family hydrolase [Halomicrobium urmianum]|uniref:HAD family hydrolase n=1 Tax=Halomicrobium urmianum TaxID=1586233 RepID=UPI001CD9B692|nr:HAD-IA family hydrolase [Halomicrobium urmianum]